MGHDVYTCSLVSRVIGWNRALRKLKEMKGEQGLVEVQGDGKLNEMVGIIPCGAEITHETRYRSKETQGGEPQTLTASLRSGKG